MFRTQKRDSSIKEIYQSTLVNHNAKETLWFIAINSTLNAYGQLLTVCTGIYNVCPKFKVMPCFFEMRESLQNVCRLWSPYSAWGILANTLNVCTLHNELAWKYLFRNPIKIRQTVKKIYYIQSKKTYMLSILFNLFQAIEMQWKQVYLLPIVLYRYK